MKSILRHPFFKLRSQSSAFRKQSLKFFFFFHLSLVSAFVVHVCIGLLPERVSGEKDLPCKVYLVLDLALFLVFLFVISIFLLLSLFPVLLLIPLKVFLGKIFKAFVFHVLVKLSVSLFKVVR